MMRHLIFTSLCLFCVLEGFAQTNSAAVDFPGNQDGIRIPDFQELDELGSDVSFCAWYRADESSLSTTNLGTLNPILYKQYRKPEPLAPAVIGLGAYFYQGQRLLNASVGTDSDHYGLSVSDVVILDEWQHVCATFEPGTFKLFLNGNLVGSMETNPEAIINNNDDGFEIGHRQDWPANNTYTWDGQIQEVAIWDDGLDESEVNQIMQCGPLAVSDQLLGYWPLSEGSGTEVSDASGQGHHGSFLGDLDWYEVDSQVICIPGCTNPESCNFDADATGDDGSCIPSGCMDSDACNFNPEASCEGEACVYTCCPGPGCCDAGMHWDSELGMCQITNPADVNVDGCVQLSDLLGILSTYGTCNDGSSWSCGQDLEYDGYEYGTLQIGGHCWFQENLKTRHYGNGDVIPIIYEDSLWAQASEGASCWLGNDSVIHHHNGRGMFYNHYAVTDERELCPSGWHVPTYHEFETLFEAVGGADIAGDALRSTLTDTECWGINAGWYDDEVTDPTDAFEFGMLATSGRSLQGGWDHPCNWGYTGWLWTTSVSYPYSPWFVYFHNDHQHVQLVKEWYGEGPERGLPVRCLKD